MIVMKEDGYNNDEDGKLFEKRENDFSLDYFFFANLHLRFHMNASQ